MITQSPATAVEPTHITGMQNVVDLLDDQLHNIVLFCSHVSANTIEAYYQQIIDTIVLNLTVIPTNQEFLHLAPQDDTAGVTAGIKYMSSRLAWFFHKSDKDVEKDLFSKMNTFPVADVRNAQWLRHTNMLH